MTRPNGVNTNYSYDSLSRLLTILHQVGANTIDGATYTYDNTGNRLTKLNHLNAVTETYGYDNIYQLLSVLQGATTTESYTYDKVGNRLSSLGGTTYTVNNANQLTTVSGSPNTTFTYDNNGNTATYDNNGNTATKVDGTGTATYTWNSHNQLTQVSLPGGGTVTFKYDPFGRRVQKVSASGTVNFIYDGANVIEELNSAGAVTAKYAQGLEVDQPVAMLRGGATSFYEADGLGSITSLSDNTGALGNSYIYESFGKLSASSGTLLNTSRYTGRDFDGENGLYYYRARYYDADRGRFLNEDPLGFSGDSANFYAYVQNGPVNFIDPLGLSSLIFENSKGTITLLDGQGNVIGTYPAANNAQNGSRGPWKPGEYNFAGHIGHPDDAPDSPYGSNGNFVFDVPGCTGCGVHSGRANTPDKRGRKGPQHATNGCIRTTDEATGAINQLNSGRDPLKKLTVK